MSFIPSQIIHHHRHLGSVSSSIPTATTTNCAIHHHHHRRQYYLWIVRHFQHQRIQLSRHYCPCGNLMKSIIVTYIYVLCQPVATVSWQFFSAINSVINDIYISCLRSLLPSLIVHHHHRFQPPPSLIIGLHHHRYYHLSRYQRNDGYQPCSGAKTASLNGSSHHRLM